ncbi:mitochondrial distribution and morphology [Savitreella phatthalungensis]
MQAINAVYTALDQGRFTQALSQCERALKRTPGNKQLIYLKLVCLVNIGDVDAALKTAQEHIDAEQAKGPSIDTLTATADLLKHLSDDRVDTFLIEALSNAFERSKRDEKIGRLWFMSCARAGRPVEQRKAAVELQKTFVSRDYFFWTVVSLYLLYTRRIGGSNQTDKLLPMLLHRMVVKAATSTDEPRINTSEELYLAAEILQALEKHEDLLQLLTGETAKRIALAPDVALLHAEVLANLGRTEEVATFCVERITAGQDDWLLYTRLIEASGKDAYRTISNLDVSKKSRNHLLALVRASDGPENILVALDLYWNGLRQSAVVFEDISPYLNTLPRERLKELFFSMDAVNLASAQDVIAACNVLRLRFAFQLSENLQKRCLEVFSTGLKHGTELKTTDNQPGNDALLLLAESLTTTSSSQDDLLKAVVILEHGARFSVHDFQIRLRLVALYRRLGAWNLAAAHLKSLSLKQMQHDTLAHHLLDGAELEYLSPAQLNILVEGQRIFSSNAEETPDMLALAYTRRTYSKIPEFVDFRERLSLSLWRRRSQLAICRLAVILDKIGIEDSSAYDNIPEVLIDNRATNVLKTAIVHDVPGIESTAARKAKLASKEEHSGIKRNLIMAKQLRELLTSGKKVSEQVDDAQTVEQAFVAGLSAIARGEKEATAKASAVIAMLVQQLQGETPIMNRDLVVRLGGAAEIVKIFALVSTKRPGPIKTALQADIKTLALAATSVCDRVSKMLDTAPQTDIVLDLADVQALETLTKLRRAQQETLVCVSSLIKSARV